MASPTVQLGGGWFMTMANFAMEAISVRWTGVERVMQDTTHLATAAAGAGKFGNRTFKQSVMVDPGSLEGSFHFNPDTRPPIGDPPTLISVTWPVETGTAANWSAQGFMVSFDVDGVAIGEKMMVNTVIKLTGEVTIVGAT